MFGDGVLLGSIVSAGLPFSMATLVGMKSKRAWVKVVALLVCVALSLALYIVYAIAWALSQAKDDGGQSTLNAFVQGGTSHIVITLVVISTALWRVPKIMEKAMAERLRLQQSNAAK